MSTDPVVSVTPPASLPSVSPTDTPEKIKAAAQQFEALLISQVLNMAHDPDGGWLGGGDSASGAATSFAEQQFAQVIAQNGGFGLSTLIAQGLTHKQDAASKPTPPPVPAKPPA
jgi:flagellar protein FlgJ